MAEPLSIDIERIETLLSSLERIAGGDIAHRLAISAKKDTFDAIAFAINILADEVSFRYDSDAKHTEELNEALRKLEQTNEELRVTQAKLIQSAKMVALGEFSSGIAHEINNPLALVRIYVDQLSSLIARHGHPLDKALLEGLDKIDSNVERMARTVKHVQDFARPTESAKTVFGLNESVSAILQLTADQLQIQSIDFDYRLADENPLIEANLNGLEHAFMNLISNASDALASKEGRRLVEIETEAQPSFAVFRITDNGVGIEPKFLEKIYEPFFTTKEPSKGTGLGLSIVYQIVKDHRAEIFCTSSLGSGTKFEIRFPRI